MTYGVFVKTGTARTMLGSIVNKQKHNLPLLGQISPFKVEIFKRAVSFATHRQSTLPTEVSLTCYGRRQAN